MKKLLAALAVLAVLFVASTYVVGTRVQPVLQEAMDKAVSQSPGLKIALKSSTSGVFTSHYVYSLVIPMNSGKNAVGQDERIVADIAYDVAHGPLPLAAGGFTPCLALVRTTFTVDPASGKDVQDFFAKLPELAKTTIVTRVAFDSSSTTDVAVPAFDKTLPGENGKSAHIVFQGLTGTIASSASMDQGNGTFSSPGITIADDDVSVALSALSLHAESRQLRPGLSVGTSSVKVKALDITPKDQPAVNLKDLAADSSITPRNNVLDYMVTLSSRFNTPKLGLIPARMSIALRNLDIDAVEHFTNLIRENQKAGAEPVNEQQIRALVKALLPRDPLISLDVIALEGENELDLHADVKTQGMTDLPPMPLMALPQLRAKAIFEGKEQSLIDLACFLTKTEKNASGENCPQELTTQIEQLVTQGYARRDGGKLKSEATWDGKALTVNGKPLG